MKHKVGPTGELRVVFDGVNVELILDYNTANNGPVKGLCGTCNDEKKLIGGDGVQVRSLSASIRLKHGSIIFLDYFQLRLWLQLD